MHRLSSLLPTIARRAPLVAAAVVAALLPVVGLASPASAAAGNVDPSFGSAGKVTTSFGAGDDEANGVAVQPDGKIVVAGFASNGSNDDFALTRYNADGTLDATFGTGGKVLTDFGTTTGDQANAVALQPDGKIVAAGISTGTTDDVAVARYNSNGTLDTTFGTGGKLVTDVGGGADSGNAVALQPDGRIVVAGDTFPPSSNSRFLVVSYKPSGALDTSFGSTGVVTTDVGSGDDQALAVALSSGGGVVAAGYATNAGTGSDFALVRYTAAGAPDTSFGTNGKVTTDFPTNAGDVANGVVVQPDGKVVAAGSTDAGTGDFAVARYLANGALDSSFGTGGRVTTDIGGAEDAGTAAVLQADGKLVVAGVDGAADPNDGFAVVRYNTAGGIDPNFDTDGKNVTSLTSGADGATAVALQPDGKIVAAGYANLGGTADFGVVRYQNDPALGVNDVVVKEGNSGNSAATFTVTLSSASTLPITVSYATANGTATAGTDYAATAGLLAFAPGETSKKVIVSVAGDTQVEGAESFFLNLSNPTNVAVMDSQGVGTIADDDGGYWLVASDGGIFAFNEPFFGSTGNIRLNKPIVGMAPTPSGLGYWLVASDGGIFSFGDATFFGSTGNIRLNQPVVGMAPTPTGKGYWMVASDGGIFAFGDAGFFGSTGNIHLNKPIVGMTSSPTGKGYWLDASDGGIFAFGDATFYGSTGNIRLNQPMVGMASTPTGKGYWLVASDGGIFAFGDAGFFGSTGNMRLNKPVRGMESTPSGQGYWLVATDGGIFSFGDAVFEGSTGNIRLNQPIVGMAAP
ncbi:MAG TPA: Calx-beta domain-containing protein [Acidimicrobiales bacterium]|nr:Calx-beta domain-containing protein [Acidimicrobiales bacterium]